MFFIHRNAAWAVALVLSVFAGCDRDAKRSSESTANRTPASDKSIPDKDVGKESHADWKHDATIAMKIVPILTEVESCAYRSGVIADRSGGFVPGPSAYFFRGHAVVSAANMKRILEGDSWTASNVRPESLEFQKLEGEPPLNGGVLTSNSLTNRLPSLSTYHSGRVFVLPEKRLVYFDLVND